MLTTTVKHLLRVSVTSSSLLATGPGVLGLTQALDDGGDDISRVTDVSAREQIIPRRKLDRDGQGDVVLVEEIPETIIIPL